MKAVVLELKKKTVAVLSDDGMITEVQNKGYAIGQTIQLEDYSMKKFNKKWVNTVAALAAMFVVVFSGGALAYNTPAAHVSMDVNPSIMYTVNIFDTVIAAEIVNPDADIIVKTIDWEGKKLSVVIEETIAALKANNYLVDKNWYKSGLLIGVDSTDKDREVRLVSAIKSELQQIIYKDTSVDVCFDDCNDIVTGIETVKIKEASDISKLMDYKVTPGKLNLVQRLNESFVSIDKSLELKEVQIEEWLHKPVEDIMRQINQNRMILKGTSGAAVVNGVGGIDDDGDGDFDDCGDLIITNTSVASLQSNLNDSCGDDCSDVCSDDCNGSCGDDCDSAIVNGVKTNSNSQGNSGNGTGLLKNSSDDCNSSSASCNSIDCNDCIDLNGVCTCKVKDAAEIEAEKAADAADKAADAADEAADQAADAVND